MSRTQLTQKQQKLLNRIRTLPGVSRAKRNRNIAAFVHEVLFSEHRILDTSQLGSIFTWSHTVDGITFWYQLLNQLKAEQSRG